MTTRDIRTSTPITICDVCGRTLLRGEREHVYLDSGARRSVCELCTNRAVHEGWVREGTVPAFEGSRGGQDRRRSLLQRLRNRHEPRHAEPKPESRIAPTRERSSLLSRLRREEQAAASADEALLGEFDDEAFGQPMPPPPPVPAPRVREPAREPRHVRAIPTSAEHKCEVAIEAFNGSEHTRTVAGVARSLGAPAVAVLPVEARPALVAIVASWELCWYRYEVDLAEDAGGVRVAAQGYELDELQPVERNPNAVADESGALSLGG